MANKITNKVLSKKMEKIQNTVMGKKSTNVILSNCYKQAQESGLHTKKWLKFCQSVKGLSRESLIKKCMDSGFTV